MVKSSGPEEKRKGVRFDLRRKKKKEMRREPPIMAVS